MSNSYNSTSINVIKAVSESLHDRYSSSQLINVLDDLLGNALDDIVRNTSYLDSMIASCLTWYSGNSRRKISSLPKQRVMYLLAIYPILSSPQQKIRVLRLLRLERNIRFFFLESFLRHADEYRVLEIRAAKTKDMVERSAILNQMLRIRGVTRSNDNLSLVGCRVRYWHSNAVKFRNQIMEKYMRHTVMRATSYFKSLDNNDRVDLSELVQNFQLALNKAINKYDQRRGTLTSCINHWLRNAQSLSGNMSHEYGIAYSVPASVKRRLACGTSNSPVNIFVPIHGESEAHEVATDDLSPEEVAERDSDIQRVRHLAKLVDPLGVGRIRLGIEELLSEQEIRALEQASVEPVKNRVTHNMQERTHSQARGSHGER